uniref:Uncharacterized protein n=1 Tax=Clandestinovirus TaxID=2831644 RepID=A0A8F8KQB1_9VIRU|nr:hypothetical protein KOM_12_567 [Clandestinovirus]
MQSNSLKYDARRAQLIPMINKQKSGKRQIASGKKEGEPINLLVVPQGRKNRTNPQQGKSKSMIVGEDIQQFTMEIENNNNANRTTDPVTNSDESLDGGIIGTSLVKGKLSFDENSCFDLKGALVMNNILSLKKWTLHPELPFVLKAANEWVPITLENATTITLPNDNCDDRIKPFVWPSASEKKKPQPNSFIASRTGLYSLQVCLGVKSACMVPGAQGFGILSLRLKNIDTEKIIIQKDEIMFIGMDSWNVLLHVDQLFQIGDMFTFEIMTSKELVPMIARGTIQLALLQSDEEQ